MYKNRVAILTSPEQWLKNPEAYVKGMKWINLHVNANKIAKLMVKSDFTIVTPSVNLNEIYFMEIPFIAIKTAQNQDDIYRYLKKKNYKILKKFNKNKFYIYAKNLIEASCL